MLEAVAQSGRIDVGLVCTSGRPNLPTQEVLTRLAASMRRRGVAVHEEVVLDELIAAQ